MTRQTKLEQAHAPTPGVAAITGLLALAGVTLLGASAIHFGLTAPMLVDRFAPAAIPEAALGVVTLISAFVLRSGRRGTWEISVTSMAFVVLLTLYGFTVTLRAGRAGDIAYHLTLLAMLFTSLGLLLSPVGRRARR